MLKKVNGGCGACIQDSLIVSTAKIQLIQLIVVTSVVKVAELSCPSHIFKWKLFSSMRLFMITLVHCNHENISLLIILQFIYSKD